MIRYYYYKLIVITINYKYYNKGGIMINLNRRFFLQGMSLSLLPMGAAVSVKENRNLFSTISINKHGVKKIYTY